MVLLSRYWHVLESSLFNILPKEFIISEMSCSCLAHILGIILLFQYYVLYQICFISTPFSNWKCHTCNMLLLWKLPREMITINKRYFIRLVPITCSGSYVMWNRPERLWTGWIDECNWFLKAHNVSISLKFTGNVFHILDAAFWIALWP